jgi:hypothetical protein|tara:strand:+ start:148 stop:357 length:210 start_codon:yes stop_codon:yes gene_type:complete
MVVKRIDIVVGQEDTVVNFGSKLDELGIEYAHLDIEKEFKSGFKGQTVTVMYDTRDMKWFATKWNDPRE